ncbi:MAG: DHHW family protein [Eubacteriales bacterium]|nr:DHHW family protein [Eubacteriales bacterium]MDD4389650.1 DHHW family protein [Eubacteriales bacterium]
MKISNKTHNLIFTAIFCAIIGGIFAASFLMPDKAFSEVENRDLQAIPKATPESIIDGGFGKSFETYAQDQFPSRDSWMRAKTGVDKLLGRYDNGNVYFGRNGWLFQKDEINKRQLKKNIEYINTYSEKYDDGALEISLLVAPTSASIMQKHLKNNVVKVLPDEKAAMDTLRQESEISLCDATHALSKHVDEYIYYRTDHHWTTLGAYYAYAGWIENIGMNEYERDDFNEVNVSDDFFGTSYSKAPLPFIKPDSMYRFDNPALQNASMTVLDAKLNEKSSLTSLYDEKQLNIKDKYSYFLSGNNPVTIITSEANTGRRLMFIKDSYGNCFAPFLTSHFDEIVVIDMRYYRNSPDKLIEQYEITDMLFLYNIQTLSNDNNLVYLMR